MDPGGRRDDEGEAPPPATVIPDLIRDPEPQTLPPASLDFGSGSGCRCLESATRSRTSSMPAEGSLPFSPSSRRTLGSIVTTVGAGPARAPPDTAIPRGDACNTGTSAPNIVEQRSPPASSRGIARNGIGAASERRPSSRIGGRWCAGSVAIASTTACLSRTRSPLLRAQRAPGRQPSPRGSAGGKVAASGGDTPTCPACPPVRRSIRRTRSIANSGR